MKLVERATSFDKSVAGAVSAVLAFNIYLFVEFSGPATLADYGWSLFILLPLIQGALAAMIVGWKKQRPARDGFSSAAYGLSIGLLILFLLAREGAICILLASPLIVGLTMLGSALGNALVGLRWTWKYRQGLFVSLLMIGPGLMFADRANPGEPGTRVVSSAVVVDATPDKVWPLLFNIDRLPQPDYWLFRLGVAHPVGTRTEGGTRYCRLTTADMPEEITAAEPGRLLAYRVLWTPPSMKETNPFGSVHAAHLSGHFEVEHGEFRLYQLPGGRTRIVGTSWYHHRFAPSWYWSLWTDDVVRHVQMRMLRAIADQSAREKH
jgi:uncharacterized protein YndB with AHSA1/START domain